MPTARGNLPWRPVTDGEPLVAAPVAAALASLSCVEVTPIDAEVADTAAFCAAHDISPESSANCVVVAGRRGEVTRHAAVLVLASDRADVNGVIRRHLDVRKISFAPREDAVRLTGMEFGGITPIGLPADWPILIDDAVAIAGPVVIGGGVRSSKLLVDGAALAALPGALVLPLALPR